MLEKLEQRVLRDLPERPANECWLWTGPTQTNGYGQFSWARKMLLAHRAAWMVWVGPIPEGGFLCHHCDVRPCCNPEHLYIGNAKTNGADAARRNRSTKGERNSHAKLSSAQVAEIRTRYPAGGILQRELAVEYGVSTNQIWRIVNKHRW